MRLSRLYKNLSNHAKNSPDLIAFSWLNQKISYPAFLNLVKQYLDILEEENIPPNSTIAFDLKKSPQAIALMVAIGEKQSSPVILPNHLGAAIRKKIIEQTGISYEVHWDTKAEQYGINRTATNHHLAGDMPLCLTTSGSTGLPKIVRLTTAGVSAFFDWSQSYFDIKPSTRVLSIAPLNFDLSLLEVWATLDAGGEVILADPEQSVQEEYLGNLLTKFRPEIIEAVPLFHHKLCAYFEKNGKEPEYMPRHIITTGEKSAHSLRHLMAKTFSGSTFHNVYGSTETNNSFILSLSANDFCKPKHLGIGSPINGVSYRIVEDEHDPTVGELQTRTPFLAEGYTNTEQTNKVFLPAYENGLPVTYYKTGDRVRKHSDGSIELLGRLDLVVKLRGVRTNLLDVEQAIRNHKAVSDAATLPYLDSETGQQNLLAVIKRDEEKTLSSLELRTHCANNLPKSALPNKYIFTQQPLPKTSTGKINRNALKQELALNSEINI